MTNTLLKHKKVWKLKLKIKLLAIFLISVLLLPTSSAFAKELYQLEIDGNSYDIGYEFDGEVIAMAIDKETLSLLIATENVQASQFQIALPNEVIQAENNEFAILVNGIEVNYDVSDTADPVLTFIVPDFTEEIEIIGTYVVPEFPLGMLLMFGAVGIIMIVIQKSKKTLFK